MSRLSGLEIAEIRARLDARSPGAWHACVYADLPTTGGPFAVIAGLPRVYRDKSEGWRPADAILWDWASREAKKRVRGESLHAIDTGAWEDVVRQWIRWTQGRSVPAAEITRAALVLARNFDALWSDWADVRVEDELYPLEPQQHTGR